LAGREFITTNRFKRFRKYSYRKQLIYHSFSSFFKSSLNFRNMFYFFISRFIAKLFSNPINFLPVQIKYLHISPRFSTAPLYLNYLTAKLYYRYILSDVVSPIVRTSLRHYRGFSINCKGRFTRAQMAIQKNYRRGSLSFSRINNAVDYSQKFVVLKYGTCNIKLWIRH
jgi:ribosomal protein S3